MPKNGRKGSKEGRRKSSEDTQKKRCRDCCYGHFDKSSSILASGYECRLNPLEPISLGLEAKHEDRDRAIEEARMIKRAYMFSNGKVLHSGLRKDGTVI